MLGNVAADRACRHLGPGGGTRIVRSALMEVMIRCRRVEPIAVHAGCGRVQTALAEDLAPVLDPGIEYRGFHRVCHSLQVGDLDS
jgi:hypothetical protein